VAIVLIILFSVAFAVLLIPFHVALTASVSMSASKFDFALSWLGLTLFRSSTRKSKKVKVEEPTKREIDVGRPVRIISLVRSSLPAISILVRSFRRALRIHRLDADLTFGLGDPSDTALVAGYLWAIAWLFNQIPSVSLSFHPQFETTALDGSGRAEAKVTMLFLLVGFLRAYTKKPFRQLIKEIRAKR
jgi:hypothetical protein